MDLAPMDPTVVLRARLRNGLSTLVPRVRARDQEALRLAYPGLAPDELARRLVADASRRSAVIGAMAAGLALTPTIAGAPVAALGQSAVVAAQRIRLAAELHETYGLPDPSPVNDGTTGYLALLANREGLPALAPTSTLISSFAAVGLAAVRALPRGLRKHLPDYRAVLTASAVLAGVRCGRQTHRFGDELRQDLSEDPSARTNWSAPV
jgi:hypothetical protein